VQEGVHQVPLVRHVIETTSHFGDVLEAVYFGISQPDIATLFDKLAAAPTYSEFEGIVKAAEGSSGLIRFMQLNLHDAITLATNGTVSRRLVRLIAGNPVTMAKMARFLGDSGSYAPVTMLIEETSNSTRVAYDTVSSALAIDPDNEDAMLTAQALDTEVLALLRRAARERG
jgi:hypothetical protein